MSSPPSAHQHPQQYTTASPLPLDPALSTKTQADSSSTMVPTPASAQPPVEIDPYAFTPGNFARICAENARLEMKLNAKTMQYDDLKRINDELRGASMQPTSSTSTHIPTATSPPGTEGKLLPPDSPWIEDPILFAKLFPNSYGQEIPTFAHLKGIVQYWTAPLAGAPSPSNNLPREFKWIENDEGQPIAHAETRGVRKHLVKLLKNIESSLPGRLKLTWTENPDRLQTLIKNEMGMQHKELLYADSDWKVFNCVRDCYSNASRSIKSSRTGKQEENSSADATANTTGNIRKICTSLSWL
ncbi:hypothetical protein BDN72DRAFT_945450 [Pluteus cervinus]|uniref:Uncharacterized protein n=1 Tax=Pluteus cervinus TaxID=181527 RepID=A0ACD3A1B2_9AGAR|nr:hypothetical protein BDN72DRAFT_945450 [Pluteus cervinus]